MPNEAQQLEMEWRTNMTNGMQRLADTVSQLTGAVGGLTTRVGNLEGKPREAREFINTTSAAVGCVGVFVAMLVSAVVSIAIGGIAILVQVLPHLNYH